MLFTSDDFLHFMSYQIKCTHVPKKLTYSHIFAMLHKFVEKCVINSISANHVLLTHWGWVIHICVSKLTIIGSDNSLSPGRRQAIIWTNAGILLIWTLGTNFSEISIDIQTFSFKKIHFKMSSGKWGPFCLGLNVLNQVKCQWLPHPTIYGTISGSFAR